MNSYCAVIKSDSQEYSVDIENPNIYQNTFLQVLANKKFLFFPEDIRIDLMNISNYVYAADRLVLRESSLDGWSRNLELNVPVLCLENWDIVKELLTEILNFLTGDKWKFSFYKREYTNFEVDIKEKKLRQSDKKEYKQVCMFSGGLDSFVGAIDILSTIERDNTLFVSHYGGGSKGTKNYQDSLIENVVERFENVETEDFFSFYSAVRNGKESTTRSRSFMFFSHAISLSKNISKLVIPENGFISLNIPLYQTRNGSSSTRTTHPYYLSLFQQLLNDLEIPVSIENPYQFQTKGEMLQACSDTDFLQQNITNTMSCSHPEQSRWSRYTDSIHCGYCIPCTIRRASIQSFLEEEPTEYRYKKYENPTGQQTFNAINIAINRYKKSNHFLKVRSSGPLLGNINEYTKVYENGMDELIEMIRGL